MCSIADGKDEQNKSHIEFSQDYGEKKGIPADRPGADTDMAQTALYIACNQYLYGQVRIFPIMVYFTYSHATQTIAVDGGYLLKHP